MSFIIPVYQVVEYLDQCLASISVQPMEDMEVWVIDDGSTDGSAEVCDKWAEKDHRFHVIHSPNQGESMARNLGMEKASLFMNLEHDYMNHARVMEKHDTRKQIKENEALNRRASLLNNEKHFSFQTVR